MLVHSARVFPGDGPELVTDVAVAGARIAAVGPELPAEHAREVVEGDGLMLCPGFIDLHAHSALQSFLDPRLLPKIAQGFTTELINPDGLAPAPVDPSRTEERRAYLRNGPPGHPGGAAGDPGRGPARLGGGGPFSLLRSRLRTRDVR